MTLRFAAACMSLAMATSAWAHQDPSHHTPAAPAAATAQAHSPAAAKLDAHTREDMERHRRMAQVHEQAAQCLAQGRQPDDCQKQLQTACKGLALGKSCGLRHAH